MEIVTSSGVASIISRTFTGEEEEERRRGGEEENMEGIEYEYKSVLSVE